MLALLGYYSGWLSVSNFGAVMRVLIVGGTGVISSGVTPRLIERGDEVVLFNRGTTAPEFDGDYDLPPIALPFIISDFRPVEAPA